MKSRSGQDIRRLYKQFFAERGHQVVQSASLVPYDDPTLLWINAGMAPLKPYFDGREIPDNPRIVSSQKCIRTNDIEEVGKTARHQTFFEMLGNFSFGDYFKKEAIGWAWEFLTKSLEMDASRLSVTVHFEDEEAFSIWHEQVGLPESRIYRGKEDNFWEIGEGPCGPCSEIFYDRGEHFGCHSATCQPGCDCDRYLEIWNLVFTQFNKEADGSYTPLPKKNIDTGSGLERLASVLQDVPNNFETDLFMPLMRAVERVSGRTYGERAEDDVHFKIIADHLRTVSFAVGDGVLPGNEGRAYIIRRLLRRAVRSGRKLGVERPFLAELTTVVAAMMGDDYPEVREKQSFIERVVRTEEERFQETLTEGEHLLEARIRDLKQSGLTELSGEDAFRLYDTFGFPIDLTIELAAESGISVDRAGFEAELEIQRERARSARHQFDGMQSDRTEVENITVPSRFVGYEETTAAATVVAMLADGKTVAELHAGQAGQLLLDVTPFYAESGGQLSDTGEIRTETGTCRVTAVTKAPHGQHLHSVMVVQGSLLLGQQGYAAIDETARRDIIKNHTATHLLHKALRQVLGTHVAQAGSLVAPDRLRFDFSHFGSLSSEELSEVERLVNQDIFADYEVHIEEKSLEEARKTGAMALFGEKYGERVRVVTAGDSVELCGGCHVARTGLIGQFLILSETGIGSGVRRVEAVSGRGAYEYVCEQRGRLEQVASILKSGVHDVVDRATRLQEEHRESLRQVESLRARMTHARVEDLARAAEDLDGIHTLLQVVPDADAALLREMVDGLKQTWHGASYVIVLGSSSAEKAVFVAAVSENLQHRGFHAGKLVKAVAEVADGSGGGKPDLAQAGAKSPEKVSMAIAKSREFVLQMKGN
ncbi:MAG: alanine--tRNA ligase [Alicyclobacillaceae bacterium]|nr:alanine--tRNA ligase [Alicyclobacillaceae bacterium]